MRAPISPRVALVATLAAVLLAAAVHVPTAHAADKQKVVGGGSTFSALLVDQWRADTKSKPYSLDINYQGSGSTQGRIGFAQRTVDFAMSDIPYQPDDSVQPAAGTFRYITLVAGALSIMFNLIDDAGNRITDLRLDSTQVCRMFTSRLVTGEPLYWDDPAIQALNPDVLLPNIQVNPVVRSDGSGTSYVLSEYCIATAGGVWNDFRAAVQRDPGLNSQAMIDGRPVSSWPSVPGFTAAPGSTGIANSAARSVGSVTYIEAGYSEITGLPMASIRNAAGRFVAPSPSGITVALSYASVRADGTFQLDFDTPDPAAYFPSTYSYMIVPTSGLDEGKARTLAEYVYYATTSGQDQCEPLEFARLSPNLLTEAVQTAAQLTGAPAFAAWAASVGIVVGSGGGSSGGGSTGGGSSGGGTGGGSTGGGGATGGGSAGGDGGGAGAGGGGGSSGGGTGDSGSSGGGAAGAAGGGSSSGGATGGGSSGGGGGTSGGDDNASGGTATTVAATGTATTVRGGATGAATTRVAGASSGGGGSNEQALPAATGGSPAVANVATAAARRDPGPSNAEVVWVMLQGAAILAAGMLVGAGVHVRRRVTGPAS